MKIEELRIKAFDKISLYVKCWLPQGSTDGVIILVHGLGEHVNRYNHWAKRFSNDGWAVVGADLRGHGNSAGKRTLSSYQTYMKDLDTVFHFVNRKFGNVPKVLYGHSLGGNLVLGYEISRKPEINRLIVTSPCLRLTRPPAEKLVYLFRLMGGFFPSFWIKKSLNSNYISRDKTVCNDYMQDPLVHHRISLSAFINIQEWGTYILKNKHKINVPLLLLHGRDDQITSWKGSYSFARDTSESTRLKIWDKCFHELHNDFCKEEIFEYISVWLSNVQKSKLNTNVG